MRRPGRALIALALTACSGGAQVPDAGPAPHRIVPAERAAQLGGRVVSIVDGSPITVDEIEEVARATGLAPIDALRRLQEERVLVAHAEAAGLGDATEIDRAARRASVQALLVRRVEAEVPLESIDDALVEQTYEAQRSRFRRPVRRRSTHVLAAIATDAPPEALAAAERFALGAIARLEGAADPVAEAHAMEREDDAGRSFRITVEELPPIAEGDALAPEFLAAVLSLREPGVVSRPIRTTFGFHAIVVTEILEAWEAPREEAYATIRRDLAAERRVHRTDELVQSIAERTPIVREAEATRWLLEADLEGEPRGGSP